MGDNVNKKYVISFPRLANYYVPIFNLLNNSVDKNICDILIPKNMSNRTLELGSKVSPDYVCSPFKYNMGNFIESLECGANVIIQAGGGCRYGYYAEVQKQILEDMGYKFDYIQLFTTKKIDITSIYNTFKKFNPKITISKLAYNFLLALKVLTILDEFEDYIRDNFVYQININDFITIHKEFLSNLMYVKDIHSLHNLKEKYFNKLYNVKQVSNLDKSKYIKIGIVGELFSSMEPFASLNIEKKLASMNVKTKRYTTATYLLFKKGLAQKKLIDTASDYISYPLGADGTESITHTLELIKMGYDGIIHIKPFGCTPEINAMPILQKISIDNNIPIMYITFDSQMSEEGFNTRIEAFYDMIKMNKEKNKLA